MKAYTQNQLPDQCPGRENHLREGQQVIFDFGQYSEDVCEEPVYQDCGVVVHDLIVMVVSWSCSLCVRNMVNSFQMCVFSL